MDEHPQRPLCARPGFDPDAWQAELNAPRDRDDEPVALTAFQADKCAAIIDAAAQGHETYRLASRDVATFFQTLALEAQDRFTVRPTSAERWELLVDVPWPLAGPPREQPDVERG